MGYGLPAAISAKLESPRRTVVCYAGDGCFQMNLQELGVALQYRLGIVILVFNNGIWGTIRAHQEREFPARTIASSFENPDFAKLVTAYRGHGEVVERTEDFGPAFERALVFAERESLADALGDPCGGTRRPGVIPTRTPTSTPRVGTRRRKPASGALGGVRTDLFDAC